MDRAGNAGTAPREGGAGRHRPARDRPPIRRDRPLARRDRPLVGLVVVLLGLVSVLVTVAGPAELGPPRIAAEIFSTAGDTTDPTEQDDVAPEPEAAPRGGGLPGWLLVAVWTLALMGLASLLLRSLRRSGPEPDPEPAEPRVAGDAAGAHVSSLGGLRDAARTAADDLRAAPAERVSDVVVLSWERLEAAAGRLGSGRPPHATPTEFTSDLLARNGADPQAAAELLRLYHRARFSRRPLPAGDGPAAVAAFDAVAASIGPAAADSRPTGTGRRHG